MKHLSLLVAAALSICAVLPVAAQPTTEAKQLATEVVELTASESMMQGIRQSMSPMFANMQKQFGDKKLNAKQQEIMQRFMEETMSYVMGPEYMGKMRVAMVESFAAVYSVEELRGIRDFFRSPVGSAYIKKTPEAMSRAMPAVQAMMEPMMRDMQERAGRLAKEMKDAAN